MPKIYSTGDKHAWLVLYEQGKTEEQIRDENDKWKKVQSRTLRDGIKEARATREKEMVRLERIRQHVDRHNDDLLNVIKEIREAIGIPICELYVGEGNEISKFPVLVSQDVVIQVELDGKQRVELGPENTVIGRSLKAHIRKDGFWLAVNKWKNALIIHINSRKALMRKLEMIEIKEAGLPASCTDIDTYDDALSKKLFDKYLNIMYSLTGLYPDGYFQTGEPTPDIAVDAQLEEIIHSLPECVMVRDSLRELRYAIGKVRAKSDDWEATRLISGNCKICLKYWKI
jgi:hypothetical protein